MRLSRLAILVGVVAGLGACTNEEVVYVNRPFNPPVDQVNGFLGYFDVAAKQTSCGNCHAGTQAQWVTSAHANAWEDLQASGGAQSFCNGCHTVSQLGNGVTGPAGYTAVADESYHDVQCESCHGAGFDHASLPDASAPPLAKLTVVNDSTSGTCGDCHSGSHHPFVEEWSQSLHAQARHTDEEECVVCHEGRGALEAWGIEANYVEHGTTTNVAIACAVCHDPHGSSNPAQLRWPLETRDPALNLCMKCHLRRDVPLAMDSTRALSPGGSNSPHAPQGSSLIGTAGYQNPSYLDPVLIEVAGAASHGNVTKNPKLCAGCHVYPFRVLDTETQDSVDVTGHLFRPIPCYGPDGVPTDTIKNCAYTPTERSFKPCAMSGCHLGENEPAAALSVARGRIQSLTAQLWVNSNTANSGIDTLDGGIIPTVLKNTWSQRGNLNNLSLLINNAAGYVIGDSVINLRATTVTGSLRTGNTIRIGTTEYTLTADVTAAANQLNGVRITPLVAPAANNAAVYVVYMAPLLAGDRVITAMDGAEFNVRLFGEDANGQFFSSNTDRSHTVHNPFLAEALLRASIEELTAVYGSQPWFPVIAPAVQQILSGPLGASGRVPFPRPAGRVSSR
jgi:predicted CXXCH cytochrome family protein